MKTKLHGLFVALALLIVAQAAAVQPVSLGIAPTNNQAVLFWPAADANYVLQSTTNLTSTNWVTLSNAVQVAGSNNTVAITYTLPATFFRLFQSTPAGMALIPAGSFTMGNSITNDTDITDATPTNVTLSAFYMDINLVTYSLWTNVYQWATNGGYRFAHAGMGAGTNHPVQAVDWLDCVKWCNARSQMAGLTPLYFTDTNFTQIFTNGDYGTNSGEYATNGAPGFTVYVNWTNSGFRLPTEAEWENAARGGTNGLRFPWGNSISETNANYFGDTSFSYDLGPNGYNTNFNPTANTTFTTNTSPVGYFPANGYGLNDMAGNVFEWCWDWYDDNLVSGTNAPAAGSPYAGGTNPRGPATSPYSGATTTDYYDARVIRGGDWGDYASSARCAYRGYWSAFLNDFGVGFRCVRGH